MSRHVCELLDASVVRYPEKIALLQGKSSWTFAEIETFSNRLAHMLIEQGVKQGDRVLLVMGKLLRECDMLLRHTEGRGCVR